MEQNASTSKVLLWILEIGLWSIMLVPISALPSEFSITTAVFLSVAVAAVNTLAVLITGYAQWTNSRSLLLAISLGVSIVWAIELSVRSDQQFVDSILALTTGPILGAWLLVQHWMKSRLPAAIDRISAATQVVALPSPIVSNAIEQQATLTAAADPLNEQLDSEADESEFAEGEHDLSDVTQSITRTQTHSGETVEGWLRIEFANGQRDATVHLSFCPPLSTSPSIEVHDVDGTDLEIKVAASFPFGARLTVRRPIESSESKLKLAQAAYRVGFVAFCAAAAKAA